jgi:hypothetical protein
MKAFPTSADNGHSQNQDGMLMRDYFAAKAMQKFESSGHSINEIATLAYKMADAMMEARKTKIGD